MQCTQCGRDNREGRKFCAHCGTELGWDCAACGFSNAAGERFCGGCGRPMPGRQPQPAPEPEPGGERRQVAVLFADLCGFTQLSRRLDAEDLHRLVEAFYARADAVIASYGGTVDKHIGDAVMALFGAPVAHGDDALRAVRAALDIHAALAELRDPAGGPLAGHVGIAMGEVVAGGIGRGYSVLGDAVNLAARLVELAGAGETVISADLRQAVDGRIHAVALPPAALKGLGEAVVAWRCDALAEAAAPATPFIGRDHDLMFLRGQLQACRDAGRGRVVVLRGEAGIGKSRLLAEAAREARTLGYAVHKGLVLDFGTGKGQDAMRLMVRSLLGMSPGAEQAVRRAAAERAERAGLIEAEARPSLDDLLDLPAEGEGRALYQAMDSATRDARRRALLGNLVRRASGERPLLLSVEDLHWADATLLDDLATLGALAAEAPILLLLTTRPEGDPLDRAWRTRLGAAPIGTLDLAPLSAADSVRLAESLRATRDDRIAACVERAGGNPFFLEQLLRHTGEVAGGAVPASIQGLVLGRADRLPPAEKRALQAAAVLGQQVPLAGLRHLLGDAEYGPDHLIDEQFLRRDGAGLAFVHALMRDGIYGSLLKARRRELHRAAASWYGERDLALKAQHLDLAEDPEAAAAYLAAAEAAAAMYRSRQALDLATRGLELAAGGAPRVALATLRGELLQGFARTEEAVAALREASETAEAGRPRLRAWLGLAHGLSVLDRFDEALALLAKAQQEAKALGLAAEESRVHGLRGNIHFPRGELDRCLAEHNEALRLAELAGAAEEQARALGGLGDAYYMRGLYLTAEKLFRRCVEISAAQGFRRIEAANLPMLAIMVLDQLHFAEALAEADRAVLLAEQIGHRRAAMIAHHARFFACFETGRRAEARWSVTACCEIAEALGARRFIAEGLMFRGLLELAEDRERARETIEQAITIAREQPAYLLPFGLALGGLAARNTGERLAALAEGERVMAAGALSHNILFFNRIAIDACVAAGDWAGVERYADALERGMADEPVPMTDLLIARARALAAAGRGQADRNVLADLVERARGVNWQVVLPALEAALAKA
ncbi:MAG: hypothetical protein QOK29_4629 [Rhodospirillaceae bacterium]|nr:hypothetical protein [Rhodospirillaceae bacterium]